MKLLALLLLMGNLSFAGVAKEVFIRGKISNEFDDKKVKVIDNLGQIYFLPKQVFPEDFKFKQGEPFALEVHENEIEKVKLLKK